MVVRALGPAVVVAVALLIVPGCGSDDEPTRLPAASASTPKPTTASPSPTASKSGSVDAATKAAAERFVRSWFAAINRAQRTGNPEPLRDYFTRSCKICRDIYRAQARLVERNQTLRGGKWHVSQVDFGDSAGPAVTVNTTSKIAPAKVVRADGSVAKSYAGTSDTETAYNLRRVGHHLVIQDLVTFGQAH